MSTECQAGASYTLKLSLIVTQQHMTHYCGPLIMAVNINSQRIKEPQQLEKAVIHSTVKALLLSASIWGWGLHASFVLLPQPSASICET